MATLMAVSRRSAKLRPAANTCSARRRPDYSCGVQKARLRVALIGNCQVAGLADCLSAICPDIEPLPLQLRRGDTPERLEQMAAAAASADAVLAQRLGPEARYGPLFHQRLSEAGGRLHFIPRMAFSGFHPDTVVLTGSAAGRLGSYHSAIIAGAWLAGLPERRVPALFNAYVFRRLGYFEEPARALDFLRGQWSAVGLALGDWSGQFMHTPNHPAVEVLMTAADQLLERLGIARDTARPAPEDRLAGIVNLPVYPELARALGVPGGRETFIQGHGDLPLESVVADAYRAYAAARPDRTHSAIAGAAELFRAEVDCAA
jgi:hypothetical protein